MRVNGTISGFVPKGQSESGEPYWADPIPCSVKVNSDTHTGEYVEGEYRQSSFTVLLESMPFTYRSVRLSRFGEFLGEFRVMSVEPLATVGRVRVIV